MDNLCHSLAGAALGQAGLKHRTALGMTTLVLASNLPDVDVAVFATDVLPMAFRRGWTHGVLAMAVLPALFAGVMLAADRVFRRGRDPARGAGLLLLSYLATWLHVVMDLLNTYGVRLLMPFSERWFYGDALYIVDPIMYATLGGAVIAARASRGRGAGAGRRAARVGLGLAGMYVAAMLVSNAWARAEVRRGLARAGQPPGARFMVSPVFGNPIRREVIVDTGDRYEKGLLWFEPTPHFRPLGYGVDINASHPAARVARDTPLFRAHLRWARFPFYVIERTAGRTRVYLSDYRYSGPGGRDGWAGVETDVSSHVQ